MSIGLEQVFEMVLANSAAASVLVGMVALSLAVFGRRLKPSWRHALWLLVVARLLAPALPESPASIFNAPHWFDWKKQAEVREFTQAPAPVEGFPAIDVDAVPVPVSPMVEPKFRWSEMAAAVLAAVGLLLLLRLPLAHAWMASRLKKAGAAPSEALQTEIAAISARIGLRPPGVLVTPLVESPALFGVLKPVLLWPTAMEGSADVAAMRLLLSHELAHVQRRDLAVNALMNAAAAVHWFNPLVWLAMRQARVEREIACDALAIEISGTAPSQYGKTMLGLLERSRGRSAPGLVLGVAEEKFSARRRMTEIAAFGSGKPSRGLAVAIAAMLLCGGLTNAQDKGRGDALQPGVAQGSNDKRVPSSRNTARNMIALEVRAPSSSKKRERATGRSEVTRLLGSLSITNFQVPAGATLGATLIKLDEAAGRADPKGRGVMFFVVSHQAAGETDPAMSAQVGDYLVNLPPTEGAITLGELLRKIAEVARPPAGLHATNRLAFAIEDYGVEFAQARFQTEPLFTRTYRLNPNVIAAAVGAVNLPEGEEERGSLLMEKVREYFRKGGIDFGGGAAGLRQDTGPQKAMFFNDRTGILFVRSTLKDLDVVETLVQAANSAPPQVVFEVVVVAEPDEKLLRAMAQFIDVRAHAGVLADPQFRRLRAELAEASRIELPKITTLSGRPARNELEKVIAVDMVAVVEDAVLSIRASASELSGSMRKSAASAKIFDGQTMFLRIGSDGAGKLSTPDGVKDQPKQPSYVFITATVIDPAGNRVLDVDNPPFDRDTVPPQ